MGYLIKMIFGGVKTLLRRLRVSAMALQALARNSAQYRLPAAPSGETDFVVIVMPLAMFSTAEVNRHVRTQIVRYKCEA